MTNPRAQVRHLVPAGITRSGARLLGAALLACAAALIVVQKRGLLDLGYVASETLAWSGHALALAGFVYLVHIWWTERFRISISGLMVLVAIGAILLGFVQHMRRSEQGGGLRTPPRAAPATLR